ncbi:ESAT-6 protein secretion system EspG family protein [Saccharopolyspora erythraea NRRL 2338]|uniref:Uncharacterized protein n=2 Tax=Saccharopolyspora erythraea TaxID=1836 RepID=A4F8E4_SACEN|nr:ESX secretion-associated protein EspG [Saccharopolyspora erythraea]EQD82270.1 secretion protein [Saccharopolyspora erythraea D]PFG94114.1 ESAT-6 protein secretion system EspG family protein [Saccharopolyspora erythraea NRRL 2338]QRK90903.1 ESX secretion-associated protein EspG [Saccharopolyspora erythraea]CAM00319.1 hypothetical protein SACE_0987 [Saccharopolyspora erythraea NRRL 2338]
MVDSFTLSLEAADILGEDLRVNLRRFPFEVPHFGTTLDQRAGIRREVWAELSSRGLADHGRPEPDVETAVKLVDRSDMSIAITSYEVGSEEVFRGCVAVSGRTGVLARQEPRGVRFEYIDVRGLARICAQLLPAHPEGHLEAATVSAGTPEPANHRADAEEQSWLGAVQASAAGRSGSELRKAQAIMALPLLRVGYFVVSGHDGAGRRMRLPAIGWRDTEDGRYSVTTRRNQAGERWNTFAAADIPKMVRYLDEQLAQLAG